MAYPDIPGINSSPLPNIKYVVPRLIVGVVVAVYLSRNGLGNQALDVGSQGDVNAYKRLGLNVG
jgi:hypothetical protein